MRRFELLRAKSVSAGYVDGPDVIHEVTLDVREHEIVTIIGSNGAGKSTFLKAVCGTLPPRSGHVRFMGEDITAIPTHDLVRRGLTFVSSGRQVVAGMTVAENLQIGAHVFASDRRRARRLLDDMFERFPVLAGKRDHYAQTLSGGEQQLLVIARGLMSRPRLLLLDEPSAGLAPLVVSDLAALIRQLRDEGVTILMVEKLARLALSLSDRIAVMESGRRVFFDTSAAAAGNPVVEEAYLGKSSPGS